ncbi:hypothetical protein C2I18_17945 [Paenibacillus sp. PK3_47]|uniref:hypothetical protein n=1 Tax=Paenibacillus sp. PK3_47 TaxID=2072642 RepID=UPI00201D7D13|nr:hypothetical protein [Paenibacillus sp. PK3_47]UQZ35235.1 hypothetical protein C2I18_17945 [Paenibacillus sp. PK3_47]
MMKRMGKTVLATAMLFGGVLGQVGAAENGSPAANKPAATAKPSATAKPTAAPVMTDNLAKYGLKKEIDLPVTLTSEGFSYTLHKIMIYDFKSAEVKKLQGLYGFQDSTGIIDRPKYFIWTKVTLENKTKKTMHGGGGDLQGLVRLNFKIGQILDAMWPEKLASKTNSKEALWTYTLKPGEKLTSYVAYAYDSEFDYFVARMFYGKDFVEKYVVSE